MKAIVFTFLLSAFIYQVKAQEGNMIITDFTESKKLEWFVINDGVMGGLSESSMTLTNDGKGKFTGSVSLENNGGFASVRAVVPETDYSNFEAITIKVRGDGKNYTFRIRTDRNFDGVTYQASFTAGDNWQEIKFKADDFTPVFRGRVVRDYPALDYGRMQQIGFLISDKQKGEFELLIDSIWME